MMHIVGTAGHVDHGKTELIKAMTGVNTDRLPEEKKRGMTIDLGFAHFPGDDGQIIGVIDVPGHERFIRNMVAGAWSLNCALLTVAANEGWMQQSTDHTEVLAAMGIEKIIVVVTKTDLAEKTQIELVTEEAVSRVKEITGLVPGKIAVSAKTGSNIEKLKRLIIEILKSVPVNRRDFPYVYIDRVFTIKGTGTVITGSLAGNTIKKDEELIVLPQNKKIRIRGIQSYYFELEEAEPVSRVALNITGLKKEELKRGNIITSPNSAFTNEKEFISGIEYPEISGSKKTVIKNHSEVEIAAGTDHLLAVVHFIDKSEIARIVLTREIPLLYNQPFLIIRHGGSTILANGRVLFKGYMEKTLRAKLPGLLSAIPGKTGDKDLFALHLKLYGYIRRNVGFTAEFPKSDYVPVGSWIFLKAKLKEVEEEILKLCAKPGGAEFTNLRNAAGISGEALKGVLERFIHNNTLRKSRDVYMLQGKSAGKPEDSLSPFARQILKNLELSESGYEPKREKLKGLQKEMRNLVRLGLAVSTEGGIYYSRRRYNELILKILTGLKNGDKFTIPEAKERTALSRKYIIPLLNKMESEGYVKRDGNYRIVIRNV
ncbi:MAG: selenocysteine-specific translation elongation factor [Spirochaetales bacterium]|nr:selenocysteine-specific translation elongation factor [Spirochaetales bacterium]